ncbi:MAG TPA: ATP-dependent metallopeptidase FtsH/Yme1/Tma family protein [Sediminispirochaeta sp.]|nr:ATP-dependent metallopeptidase FtsH/Yme1/Tma family protein [Sediminispirochaeta sp.]
MAKKTRSFARWQLPVALLALLLVRPIVGFLFTGTDAEYSYSEFKTLVQNSAVQEVVIMTDRIEGTLHEGGSFYTVRVNDPGLLPILEEYNVNVRGRNPNPLFAWLFPLAVMIGFSFWMMRRIRGTDGGMGAGLFSFSKSKARMSEGEHSGVTFEDIGGAREAITDLQEITDFLKDPEHFQRLGGKMPKGVLLVGPPGTGKTLLAKATAGEAKVPFFSLSGAEFVEMFVGVGASRVRDLFGQAKKKVPAIIFIDEIDAIGGKRGSVAGLPTNDEREQTLNQLLAEMDGFQPTTGLILIAATNRPEVLDTALLRPGRFDRQVVVGLPDLTGRHEIYKIHTENITLAPDVDLENLSRITPGFSGADVANVINEAALLASREGKDAVSAADFDSAIERVVAGSERRTRAMNEREKKVVAAHESGHALTAALLPNVDPVHKVSIIPRGNALGYTWQRPVEDRYLMGQGELEERLIVLLGGRAAEKIVFSEVSTGAADDLARATELARRMISEYGMSEKLGPVRLAADTRTQYLGVSGHLDSSISTTTAALVEGETSRLVSDALKKAMELLNSHISSLETLMQRLCEEETVSGERIKAILENEKAPNKESSSLKVVSFTTGVE